MKNLKKWLFPGSVVAVLTLGIATVQYSKPNPNFTVGDEGWKFNFSYDSSRTIQPSGKMVEVLLNPDVKSIRNAGRINVTQYCSRKAKGSIELDSALLAVLDQALLKQGIIKSSRDDFASTMQAISFQSDHEIEYVENSGVATVRVQCPSILNLTVRNLGAGGVDIATPFIQSVSVENLGVGHVYAPHVDNISIDSRGTGNVAVGEAKTADVKLYGVGTVSFKNTPQITSTIKGMGSIKTNEPHPYD
jgi:hypothetical protein